MIKNGLTFKKNGTNILVWSDKIGDWYTVDLLKKTWEQDDESTKAFMHSIDDSFHTDPDYAKALIESYQIIRKDCIKKAPFEIKNKYNYVVFKGHKLTEEEKNEFGADKDINFDISTVLMFSPYQATLVEEIPEFEDPLEKSLEILEWCRTLKFSNLKKRK